LLSGLSGATPDHVLECGIARVAFYLGVFWLRKLPPSRKQESESRSVCALVGQVIAKNGVKHVVEIGI
jgi:hypothetical protein